MGLGPHKTLVTRILGALIIVLGVCVLGLAVSNVVSNYGMNSAYGTNTMYGTNGAYGMTGSAMGMGMNNMGYNSYGTGGYPCYDFQDTSSYNNGYNQMGQMAGAQMNPQQLALLQQQQRQGTMQQGQMPYNQLMGGTQYGYGTNPCQPSPPVKVDMALAALGAFAVVLGILLEVLSFLGAGGGGCCGSNGVYPSKQAVGDAEYGQTQSTTSPPGYG